VWLIESLSGNANLEQVANAHMIFNIPGVLLFIPFISIVVRTLNKCFLNGKLTMNEDEGQTKGIEVANSAYQNTDIFNTSSVQRTSL
jgi:Na+/phosphate symporter